MRTSAPPPPALVYLIKLFCCCCCCCWVELSGVGAHWMWLWTCECTRVQPRLQRDVQRAQQQSGINGRPAQDHLSRLLNKKKTKHNKKNIYFEYETISSRGERHGRPANRKTNKQTNRSSSPFFQFPNELPKYFYYLYNSILNCVIYKQIFLNFNN